MKPLLSPRSLAWVLAALALPMLFACAPADTGTPEAATETAAAPEATAPAPFDADPFTAKADEWIAKMTLEEKVGQMTQADMSYIKDETDIATYFLGSVLSGGGSDPTPENTLQDWRDMVERFQAQARTTRLGIPLLYGVDAVHGHNNVVGATIFPHNIGLGATRDADLVERINRATAIEVRATGINWNFSPCLAVARDIRWGRTYESFAEEPEIVTELGTAAVRGLQGAGLSDQQAVLGCLKHWVADGGTTFGTGTPKDDVPDSVFDESGRTDDSLDRWPLDRGDTQMDEEELRRIHVAPYLPALNAGVASVMPSFSSWNGEKLSGHKYLMTDVLKGELGFEGFLISDWAAIDDLPGDYMSDVVDSINAGMDMVMVPDRYQEFYNNLLEAAKSGAVSMERIDDAVRRILRVKIAMGLLDDDPALNADRTLEAEVGSDAHRALAREAVAKSLVVLKDDGVLPLKKDAKRIHVVGKSADDLGNQCGGWSIQWQGQSGEITVGTTVLEALRAAVGESTEITVSADGSGAEGADVVLAVIGETPYAEMMGDRTDLSLDDADREAVERAHASGVPVVTVLISGRPLILNETLDQSAAFVAAWLPGTEGAGITDVLFGDVAATGRLSFSWPGSMDQVAVLQGDEGYAPLFPFGYRHGD
ncbi:MAG: glycoside hydrolase family 3 N-terminal domain-containing protein [Acidobacteriota bacterium]